MLIHLDAAARGADRLGVVQGRAAEISSLLPVLFGERGQGGYRARLGHGVHGAANGFLERNSPNSIASCSTSIEATMQTEGFLKQSQQLAGELQAQQKELQQTNEQLEQKAQQLAERNVEVERKNQEIEQARRALEDRRPNLH